MDLSQVTDEALVEELKLRANCAAMILETLTDAQIETEAQDRMLFPEETEISDFSDEEIDAEYRERHSASITAGRVADELYRSRAHVPEIVKDWLYQETGRTLP